MSLLEGSNVQAKNEDRVAAAAKAATPAVPTSTPKVEKPVLARFNSEAGPKVVLYADLTIGVEIPDGVEEKFAYWTMDEPTKQILGNVLPKLLLSIQIVQLVDSALIADAMGKMKFITANDPAAARETIQFKGNLNKIIENLAALEKKDKDVEG